jgi:hypothetical protein
MRIGRFNVGAFISTRSKCFVVACDNSVGAVGGIDQAYQLMPGRTVLGEFDDRCEETRFRRRGVVGANRGGVVGPEISPSGCGLHDESTGLLNGTGIVFD